MGFDPRDRLEQKIEYGTTKNKSGKSGLRFTEYRNAKSIGEMFAKGGTPDDLVWDFKKDYVRLVDTTSTSPDTAAEVAAMSKIIGRCLDLEQLRNDEVDTLVTSYVADSIPIFDSNLGIQLGHMPVSMLIEKEEPMWHFDAVHLKTDDVNLDNDDLVYKMAYILEASANSRLLWGVSAPDEYHVLLKHGRALLNEKDKLEREYFSEFWFDADMCALEDELNLPGLQLGHHVEVVLHILTEDDIELDPVKIKEINKDDSFEERRRKIEAIKSEIGGLCKLGCFELDVLPMDRTPISTKLILKVKRNADGSYLKHKARLVVRGFSQKFGDDFFSTFSPTSMLATTRLIMAIAVHHGLPLLNFDISTAFVQEFLNRDIFATMPNGVKVKDEVILKFLQERNIPATTEVVARLRRALYGLKQSPMLWNECLNKFMKSHGFRRTASDTCLYEYHDDDGFVMVSFAVDDGMLTGSHTKKIEELHEALEKRFGLGQWDCPPRSFLGINMSYDQMAGILRMDVRYKTEKIFEEHPKLRNLRPISDAPYTTLFSKSKEEDDYNEVEQYIVANFAKLTGSLLYLAVVCRSDLTTLINKAAQGMHAPDYRHVVYLEYALRYMKGTASAQLVYRREGAEISGIIKKLAQDPEMGHLPTCCGHVFSDSDFANSLEFRMRSTSGYCVYVYGCLIAWFSKRQSLAAKSTMEAELIAAASASDEGLWLYHLVCDLPHVFGYKTKEDVPSIPLMVDNTAALAVINHPKTHAASRHIQLREFRIRDFHEAGMIRPFYISTLINPADHFSKLLVKEKFVKNRRLLGIENVQASTELLTDVASYERPSKENEKYEDESCSILFFSVEAQTSWLREKEIRARFRRGHTCST